MRHKKKLPPSTHEALRFMLILAQCFAMFPITGITGPDFTSLRFKWRSFRFFYSLTYVLLLFTDACLYLLRVIYDTKFGHFVSMLFFACSFVTALAYIKLTTEWPDIMEMWTKVDQIMSRHNYEFPRRLHFRLKTLAATVMIAAALEHSFYLSYAVVVAPQSLNTTEAIHLYMKNSFIQIFSYIPCCPLWIGLFGQTVSFFSTVTWNYMDLFIMVLSLILADRFKQVGARMGDAAENKIKNIMFWREIREDYNRLALLCKRVDKALSSLILLSFGNNLFVILVQLLNTLEPRKKNDVVSRLYFLYSFGFLILRAVAVSQYAARIDVESTRPIEILIMLPSDVFNTETDRLLQQIKMDPCCLTGRQYFSVKKTFILNVMLQPTLNVFIMKIVKLQVTGAILTYELILLQFHLHY